VPSEPNPNTIASRTFQAIPIYLSFRTCKCTTRYRRYLCSQASSLSVFATRKVTIGNMFWALGAWQLRAGIPHDDSKIAEPATFIMHAIPVLNSVEWHVALYQPAAFPTHRKSNEAVFTTPITWRVRALTACGIWKMILKSNRPEILHALWQPVVHVVMLGLERNQNRQSLI
jgi:hypothetical protein